MEFKIWLNNTLGKERKIESQEEEEHITANVLEIIVIKYKSHSESLNSSNKISQPLSQSQLIKTKGEITQKSSLSFMILSLRTEAIVFTNEIHGQSLVMCLCT